MLYLYAAILVLLNSLFLFLTLLGLPGNWLMLAATALLAWWQWDQRMITLPPIIALLTLAAIGELLEFLSSLAGAKKAGASRAGSLGALIGGIVGAIIATFAIPIPILGSLIGACGGAALGAWSLEIKTGRDHHASARSALGASIGTILGRAAKIAAGIIIWIIAALAAFCP